MSNFDGRTFAHWLADSFRYLGALIYWNARKGSFVRRGRTGGCPCQNPSDDPSPGRVRCDAVAHWRDPSRFGSVCPLLVHTENGWCCSVRPSQVRPFWGRALLRLGALAAIAYVLISGVTFAIVRIGGAPISPTDVLWPGRWGRVRYVQAEEFYRRAMAAFQRGHFQEAALALSSAHERDPKHYEASLMLAQVTAFQGSATFADAIFWELMQNFPEQRRRTAVTQHDTYLMLGRFEDLGELCVQMARGDPGRAAVWVRSLLFSLRHRRDAAAFIAQNRDTIRRLAPHAQELITAERQLAQGDRNGAIATLRNRFSGPFNPTYMREQVARLAQLGDYVGAQALLDFYGPILGELEHGVAQMSLDAESKDPWAMGATLRALLASELSAAQLERIAETLVRHPSRPAFAQLHDYALARLGGATSPSAAAMWVAALRCQAPEAEFWRLEVTRRSGERPPAIGSIDVQSRALNDPSSVVHIVNVVTFPREMVLGLLEEVAARPMPAQVLP